MGDAYDDLIRFIQESDLQNKVEFHFVDLIEDDVDEFDAVKQMVSRGFALPLIAINGQMKFYGGISNEATYKVIKELL